MTLLHEAGDLLDRMNDGGVVPSSELPPDGRVTEVGQFAEHVHADLPGGDQRPAPIGPAELFDRESESVRGSLEDDLRGDPSWLVGGDDVRQDLFGQLPAQRLSIEAG